MFSRFRETFGDIKVLRGIRDSLPAVAASAVVVVVSGKVVKYLYTYNKLRRIRNAAIKDLQASKESWRRTAMSKISEEDSERIVSMGFNDLSAALREGRLTAVEVLRAFQRKAAVEDERLNFVCEPLDPVEAENMAERLDAIPVSERASLPLFGIPITVKETELIAGYCSSMGLTAYLGNIATHDSPRIKIMKDFGAVPYIRTNIPQALLAFSTSNPIYGETVNPWNTARDCGGSSGGEAAAIACGASVLGLGSDIGGSLRIPSAWCGITAIKPTAERMSARYRMSLNDGQTCIKSTVGPMAATVDALILSMRVMATEEMFELDPTVVRQPFNDQELNSERPLTIGLMDYDGSNDTSAACKRALKMTADILTAKGHKIVQYKLRDNMECYPNYFTQAIFADGGKLLCQSLYGDSMSGDMTVMHRFLSLPLLVKKFINPLLYLVMPKPMYSAAKNYEGLRSVDEWFALARFLQGYRNQVVDDWKSEHIDAVLCPAMPIPALPLGDSSYAKSVISYVTPWNVLNFPAGVVPVCTVTSEDTAADAANFQVGDFMQRMIKRGLTGSEGLPMAVQLVTLPYREEQCLRLMKEVESAAGFQSHNRSQ